VLRFLGDVVQRVVVLLNQLVEAAPARVLGWDFRPLDPTAVGVKEKIVGWFSPTDPCWLDRGATGFFRPWAPVERASSIRKRETRQRVELF